MVKAVIKRTNGKYEELTAKTLEELFDVMGTDVEDLSATVVDEGDWAE